MIGIWTWRSGSLGSGVWTIYGGECWGFSSSRLVACPLTSNCNVVISMVPATARSRSWLPERKDSLIQQTPLSSRPSGQPDHRSSSVRAYKQPSGKMLKAISDILRPPKPSTATRLTTVGGAPHVINQSTDWHLGCMGYIAPGLCPSTIYPIQPTWPCFN